VGDRGLTAIRTRGFKPFLIHPGPKERDAQLLSLTDVISCATRTSLAMISIAMATPVR
jgi:hypothetical protein